VASTDSARPTIGQHPGRRPLVGSADVARFLGIPEKTVIQWRYLRTGPRWSKVGRHVRYRWEDVEGWLDEQSHTAVV
jgi:predicted DNA-binding transcriptional regulator AlpA